MPTPKLLDQVRIVARLKHAVAFDIPIIPGIPRSTLDERIKQLNIKKPTIG
jgi:hypothetical protein